MNDNIICYLLIVIIIIISIKSYYDSDLFQLKCIISDINGKKYCVRERKNIKKASDLLAITTKNMTTLVKYLIDKYPDKESVILLHKNFNPKKNKRNIADKRIYGVQ